MLQAGDIVDNKYKVTDSGGMGTILFIESLIENPSFRLVLKYCKETTQESIQRFCREIRYLNKLKGIALRRYVKTL